MEMQFELEYERANDGPELSQEEAQAVVAEFIELMRQNGVQALRVTNHNPVLRISTDPVLTDGRRQGVMLEGVRRLCKKYELNGIDLQIPVDMAAVKGVVDVERRGTTYRLHGGRDDN